GAEADAPAEERNHLVAAPAEVLRGRIADEVEEGGAVEEEIAPLGKKQREAGEVDLSLIDLDLREVCIYGQVRANGGRGVVKEIDAGVGVAIEAGPAPPRRPGCAEQAIRLDVEAAPLRDVADAGDEPGVRHPLQPLVAHPPHPDADLVAVVDS